MNRAAVLISLALAALTLATFGPSCRNGFVNFDDPIYVTWNPHTQRGLCWDSLKWAWTDLSWVLYDPLTRTSMLVDYELYGLKATGYHVTNVLLHTANVLLVFWVLRRWTKRLGLCAALAALYAVHPLRVESVVWITERKDVLSTFFGLLALAAYGWYSRRPSAGRLVLVTLLMLTSLSAKPMFVTLPFLLLLLDVWPLQRFDRPWRLLVLEKWPLFVLSLFASILEAWVHAEVGVSAALGDLGLSYRLGNALVSCVKYLGMTFWPVDLAPYYPHPFRSQSVWQVGAAFLVLAVLGTWAWRRRRDRPWLVVGYCWFLGTLVPVLGLSACGAFALADRYTYVPHIGLFVAIFWEAAYWSDRSPWMRRVAISMVGAAGIACVPLTMRQAALWQDSETLWRHALRVTERNGLAHGNLAATLKDQHRDEEAVCHYQASLLYWPDNLSTCLELGELYQRLGRFPEARRQLDFILSVEGEHAQAHRQLGLLLLKQGELTQAEPHLRAALQEFPDSAELLINLGSLCERRQDHQAAEENLRKALRQEADNPAARANLGLLLYRQGRRQEALAHLGEAVRLDGTNVTAQVTLGTLLQESGELDRAAGHLMRALNLDSGRLDALVNLGVIRERQGRLEAAARLFEKALQREPGCVAALDNLGIVRHRQGRLNEARASFEQAVQRDPSALLARCSLASVLADQDELARAQLHWNHAYRLDPHWPDHFCRAAWQLATAADARRRHGAEAARLARQACQATGNARATYLDVAAAALAECGQFGAAVATARQAEACAAAEQVRGIQARRRRYEAGKPWRAASARKLNVR